jgi:hypothetical protein
VQQRHPAKVQEDRERSNELRQQRAEQYAVLFQLRKVKYEGVDDSEYIHALTYVELSLDGVRDIVQTEVAQLKRLHRALTYIVKQKAVPITTLRAALSDEQYAEYIANLNWHMSHAESEQNNGEVPQFLADYADQIRKGDRYTRIANMFKHTTKRDARGKTAFGRYEALAFGEYEEAILDLVNALETDPERTPYVDHALISQIIPWLDREVDTTHGNAPDISNVGVPRLRGSKSKYALISAQPVVGERLYKHWRQREAVAKAALPLLYNKLEIDDVTDEQRVLLKRRLAALLSEREN